MAIIQDFNKQMLERATAGSGATPGNSLLNPAPVVDPAGAAYLARYPDVANKAQYRANPRAHYDQYGKAEGRVWGEATAPTASPTPAVPITASPQTAPATYGNTDEAWSNFLASGRADVEGQNRMPGVFSNYAGVPTDPAVAQAQAFYQTPSQHQAALSPLLHQLLGPALAVQPATVGKK